LGKPLHFFALMRRVCLFWPEAILGSSMIEGRRGKEGSGSGVQVDVANFTNNIDIHLKWKALLAALRPRAGAKLNILCTQIGPDKSTIFYPSFRPRHNFQYANDKHNIWP